MWLECSETKKRYSYEMKDQSEIYKTFEEVEKLEEVQIIIDWFLDEIQEKLKENIKYRKWQLKNDRLKLKEVEMKQIILNDLIKPPLFTI